MNKKVAVAHVLVLITYWLISQYVVGFILPLSLLAFVMAGLYDRFDLQMGSLATVMLFLLGAGLPASLLAASTMLTLAILVFQLKTNTQLSIIAWAVAFIVLELLLGWPSITWFVVMTFSARLVGLFVATLGLTRLVYAED